MKRDYKLLLKEGRKAQLEKLHKNDHKCGFDIEPIQDLFDKLEAEVKELMVEVFALSPDYRKIRREAADVANFAFMIILKCVQLMSHKRK